MFTQKKKRFYQQPVFYAVVALCALSAGLTAGLAGGSAESGVLTTDVPAETAAANENGTTAAVQTAEPEHTPEAEPPVTTQTGYYLIKQRNGAVNVYAYDASGTESFFMSTDIAFSLISSEDQNMFTKGVVAESKEALYAILEDFES